MKTIIATNVYSGEFLVDDEYIEKHETKYASDLGGEIINLFKTDQGENYVYINKDGIVGEKYDDTVEAVYMIKKTNIAHLAEIVAAAIIEPGGQIAHNKSMKGGRFRNSGKEIYEYLEKHPITYASANFADIHKGNINGMITFKAQKILFPTEPMFLAEPRYKGKMRPNYYKLEKNILGQSMKTYYTDAEHSKSYTILSDLIKNEKLWDEERSGTVKIDKTQENYFNFLSIIKKEDDELAFSNLFYYFLNQDRDLFCAFCKEVLNVEMSPSSTIEREHGNIDLYFCDQNNIVVIENKIKSGINGVDKRHDFSTTGKVQSQLKKYYDLANIEASESGKKPYFFIFMPDYSSIDLSRYEASSRYKLVEYSTLYEFFNQHKAQIPQYQEESGYYRDFCRALYRHTKSASKHLYDKLESEFIKRIKAAKNTR